MTDRHVAYFDEASFVEVKPGFRRRIITGDDLMLCYWRIRAGSGPTPYDNHPDNEQFGMVIKGRLDFRIGSGERRLLGPGDTYWAPRGLDHGDSRFIGDPEYCEACIHHSF